MPAAYLIVEMNISDPERYKQYMAAAPAAVKAAGGEYLVRGGRHETLEGDWQPHRVAVLRRGVLMQCASPAELYETPDNLFVAQFIGSPSMNVLQQARRCHRIFQHGPGRGRVRPGLSPPSQLQGTS